MKEAVLEKERELRKLSVDLAIGINSEGPKRPDDLEATAESLRIVAEAIVEKELGPMNIFSVIGS